VLVSMQRILHEDLRTFADDRIGVTIPISAVIRFRLWPTGVLSS
jgi:hypothetical protein